MFDLEEVISEWRRQMLAAGIKNPCRWMSWKVICGTIFALSCQRESRRLERFNLPFPGWAAPVPCKLIQ